MTVPVALSGSAQVLATSNMNSCHRVELGVQGRAGACTIRNSQLITIIVRVSLVRHTELFEVSNYEFLSFCHSIPVPDSRSVVRTSLPAVSRVVR
jgi:hypothetical protein